VNLFLHRLRFAPLLGGFIVSFSLVACSNPVVPCSNSMPACGNPVVAPTSTMTPGYSVAPSLNPAPSSSTTLSSPSPLPSPAASGPATPVASSAPSLAPPPSLKPDPATPDSEVLPSIASANNDATITVFNLSDGDITINVSALDPKTGKYGMSLPYSVGVNDRIWRVVSVGQYQIKAQLVSPTTALSCVVTIKGRNLFTFVAVPGAIAITRAGYTPTNAADLFMPTSSLCK
jgi:hypothetical protein